jgi:hypothetical protein
MSEAEQDVTMTLSGDAALVLLDFIDKLKELKVFETGAQEIVFNGIECDLERVIVAQFKPNYQELVANASSRIEALGSL